MIEWSVFSAVYGGGSAAAPGAPTSAAAGWSAVGHGHGLPPAGEKVFDKRLPNSEPKLRSVFDKLTAKFGTVLVMVGQARIRLVSADAQCCRSARGLVVNALRPGPSRAPR